MNKPSIWILLAIVLLAINPMHIQAQELRVSASLVPPRDGVQLPKVQVVSEDMKIEVKGQRTWAYEPKEAGKLIGTSSVAFEQQPTDYSSERLIIRLPSDRRQPLQVSLFGLQVQDTNKRVREIFGTTVTTQEMRSEELFSLYQETAFISARRLNSIQKEGRGLYKLDAQIFFKYLEIARELGRHKFVAVSDNVLRIQSYLREQLGLPEGRSAITKALGPNGPTKIRTLLNEIDFVDAEQLRQVWQALAKTPPSFSPEDCSRYKAFVKTLEDYDELLVKRWNADKEYTMATLAVEALATCTSRAAANASDDSNAAAVEIADLAKVANSVSNKEFADTRIKRSASNIEDVVRRLGIKF